MTCGFIYDGGSKSIEELTSTFTTNTWQHIQASFIGSTSCLCFLNSVMINVGQAVGTLLTTYYTEKLNLGLNFQGHIG